MTAIEHKLMENGHKVHCKCEQCGCDFNRKIQLLKHLQEIHGNLHRTNYIIINEKKQEKDHLYIRFYGPPCPECGRTERVKDPQRGLIICVYDGNVLENQMFKGGYGPSSFPRRAFV